MKAVFAFTVKNGDGKTAVWTVDVKNGDGCVEFGGDSKSGMVCRVRQWRRWCVELEGVMSRPLTFYNWSGEQR